MLKLSHQSGEELTQSVLDPSVSISNMIFVFGSNEAGRHGAGAARYARMHRGAVPYKGVGRSGQSYAIPTKDAQIKSLRLENIRYYVDAFIEYAKAHPELTFQVTCIGCGLAGFRDDQIAPMFNEAPPNCYFDLKWQPWLPERQFWGTF